MRTIVRSMSAYIAGELSSWPTKEVMATILRAAGLRVNEEPYAVRVEDCAHFVFAEYGGDLGPPLIDAEADSVENMKRDGGVVSQAFALAGLRHRFEIYNERDELSGYLHHDWPMEQIAEPNVRLRQRRPPVAAVTPEPNVALPVGPPIPFFLRALIFGAAFAGFCYFLYAFFPRFYPIFVRMRQRRPLPAITEFFCWWHETTVLGVLPFVILGLLLWCDWKLGSKVVPNRSQTWYWVWFVLVIALWIAGAGAIYLACVRPVIIMAAQVG